MRVECCYSLLGVTWTSYTAIVRLKNRMGGNVCVGVVIVDESS